LEKVFYRLRLTANPQANRHGGFLSKQQPVCAFSGAVHPLTGCHLEWRKQRLALNILHEYAAHYAYPYHKKTCG
jgi:hypothetical protein